jgi:hypothetical protein
MTITKKIINSEDFKNKIKSAIKDGVGENWGWDGQDEYPYETFDPDISTESVIEVLIEFLKNKRR